MLDQFVGIDPTQCFGTSIDHPYPVVRTKLSFGPRPHFDDPGIIVMRK
jgi:hypothetical protein